MHFFTEENLSSDLPSAPISHPLGAQRVGEDNTFAVVGDLREHLDDFVLLVPLVFGDELPIRPLLIDFDAVVCGGNIGILLATALVLRGLRVHLPQHNSPRIEKRVHVSKWPYTYGNSCENSSAFSLPPP